MRVGALRPVGEQVSPFPGDRGIAWPDGYRRAWVDSGTTALAVALRAVLSASGPASRAVVLPAYTCPDVLSAVLWSDGEPRIVDTCPGTPWLDPARMADVANMPAAVVAPHFVGIRHPLGELQQLCTARGAVLVEDSAQLGMHSHAFEPIGDLVVLSFGRGKPMPVSGGMLLYSESKSAAVEAVLSTLPLRQVSALHWRGRMMVQNSAMSRFVYGLARGIPALGLGETRYCPLLNPVRLEGPGLQLAEAALGSWSPTGSHMAINIENMVSSVGLPNLTRALGWDGQAPLLRYPLLMPSRGARDALVARLEGAGLGASGFYRFALPYIEGVPPPEIVGGIESATDFAGQLMTLPCHSGVRDRDLERMALLLEEFDRA